MTGTPKPISEAPTIFIMKQLTLDDTRDLVSKLVRSIGERATARKLTEMGYKSPEGKEVRQGHVARIMGGSFTMLQAPEEPPIEPISAPVSTPAARYAIPEPAPEHYLEKGPVSANASPNIGVSVKETGEDQDPREVRRLREELLDQEELRKELEENAPPEVPRTSDYSRSEHSHPERFAKVSGIFSRRGEVQLDPDDKDFFGIPRLARQPQKTIVKPHETKSYAKLSMNAMEPYTLQSKRNREERN